MKILITGSLGYIGSVLTRVLAEAGHDCVGYDTGFFAGELLYPPENADTVFGDARELAETDLQGVDVVVHLAGISNDPLGSLDAAKVYDPTRTYSMKIAKMCKALGVRFIFASSCSVYGIGQAERLTESSQTNPQTAYSLNKYQIEEDLKSISDKDFSPIALRFATVFGSSPRIRFDVVINMLTGMAATNKLIVLNSDGNAWRPNLHILDACQSILHAIELDYRAGELLVLNVGSNENNLRIIDIARTIQDIVKGCELKFLSENPDIDKEGLIRDRKVAQAGGDTRTYQVSFDRIKTVLPRFKCEWSIERGVQEMVERFIALPLTYEAFKRRGFYRLQQLEHLHGKGFISDDLLWVTERQKLISD
jgi:nucleoside-diphosphate-sugar epimerase